MQIVDKAVQKFESQGREGVAEARAARKVNRGRAAGVVALSLLGLVGPAVALGGARKDGLDGSLNAIGNAYASPFKNAQGQWDMPLIDIPLISVNNNANQISVDVQSGENELLETCPTTPVAVTLGEGGYGDYVSTATYDLNAEFIDDLGGSVLALDPLWQNYFEADNIQNPNNPLSSDVVLRRLITVDNCSVR